MKQRIDIWEYTTAFLGDGQQDKTLKQYGDLGWELVSVTTSYTAYFKRKKTS
jgi:hypothetical protein